MAVAYLLTEPEIKKKFKCSLEELKKHPNIRTAPSAAGKDKFIVVVFD